MKILHTLGMIPILAAIILTAFPRASECQSVGVQSPSALVAEKAFEAVSIKLHDPSDPSMMANVTADRFSFKNFRVKDLVSWAYPVQMPNLILGIPAKFEDIRFDVVATVDDSTANSMKEMSISERRELQQKLVQGMLKERFDLKVHQGSKEVPEFALVVAKSGFKLKGTSTNDSGANGVQGQDGKTRPGTLSVGLGFVKAQGRPISSLTVILQGVVQRIVIDKTGIMGNYDYELHWTPENGAAVSDDGVSKDSDISIYTALTEQIGLRLEPIKGMANTVVVDRVEMPSAN